jgi:hypothetical protein
MKHALIFLVGVFACGACHSAPPDPNNGNGELHEGNFVYACASDADAFCAKHVKAPLPEGIAVGADFRISFADGMNTLESDPDMIAIGTNGAMHANRAGYAAVLARTANGDVVDFVNLRIHVVAELAIRDADATMRAGETRVVRAEPIDQTGSALAGTLAFEWESSDPNVVTIDTTQPNHVVLNAVGAGVARVRVVSGATTGIVTVTVGGA